MAITTILFDLDGTLIDTQELILTSMRYTTQQVLKEEIPDELLMEKVGQPLSTQMWDYTSEKEVHDELIRAYRKHNAQYHDSLAKPFPGTKEAVQSLSEMGYTLGVVTSKRHDPAVRGLELFGLNTFMKCIVGADDCEHHKPHPEPVLKGAELLGTNPYTCVYLGDSPYDMQSGKAAGTTTVAALWGMFDREILEATEPDHVCASITDFESLMRN